MGDVIIDGLTGANRLVILDTNGKIPALDGSAVTALAGANFSTGTIPVARLDTGTTAGKVVKLDGNAKLPAVSGLALTGVVGATKNASDPTISTNPSGGVGTEWQNTTSGEVYVCTDATAGENVWKNVGEQSGNIEPVKWYGPRGVMGGGHYPTVDTIDYVTIATTGNAIDFGNLIPGAMRFVGGYSGDGRGIFLGGTPPTVNVMQYITCATPGNGVDFGDLTGTASQCEGVGGLSDGSRGVRIGGSQINILDYVTIATIGNATDFGDTVSTHRFAAGVCNGTYGLYAGGNYPNTNTIDKITVATTGNAIDWADQLTTGHAMGGVGNETRGIWFGGYSVTAQNTWQNILQYVTIATQANTVDFGDLLNSPSNLSGVTDATKGVIPGGALSSTTNVIQYVTIATTGNATDFGDLTVARYSFGNASG